ncbi:hypothetical protein [Hyalangium rubrum]|uniref:Lipoprotein n=1 Tax=Hyalangium rubrum TaxID=3103134 RepID=A0ABU5HFR3_9BACT|nr:hypothetical protein [Hyalangium sp. s54d21]MDY7231642.1 hypothetical protein [Hyalangium sp. s54d21]
MARHPGVLLIAVLALAGGCKKPSDKPIAGLHSAGAPVLLIQEKEKTPIPVGSHLRAQDQIVATGPALLEYFGGGMRFLESGDELEVGDVNEAKLVGSNIPSHQWVEGQVQEAPPAQRIVAARYTNVAATPTLAGGGQLTNADYFKAFFAPGGMENLMSGPRGEGPSKKLPAPPFRPKVPFIHAGALGEGGFVAEVTDGFAVAETDDLATAVLLEDRQVPLGRTGRLIVPRGAEVVLKTPEGKEVELEGPADLRFR